VKIGRWAKDNLPANARIGVNDTGAIAYFSDRHTFDIVGLTSEGEARYWVAGQASRVEHYERLARERPGALPTHFIVYPEWMGTDAILGEELYDATVTDSTILGGQSMRAYVADWSMLGSGENPWTKNARVIDALDVADLESEAAHGYELLGAHENEEYVNKSFSEDGVLMIDGGRGYRTADAMTIDTGDGGGTVVMRAMETPGRVEMVLPPIDLDVTIGGASAGAVQLAAGGWQELSIAVPPSTKGKTRLEVRSRDGSMFTTFHYWSVAR